MSLTVISVPCVMPELLMRICLSYFIYTHIPNTVFARFIVSGPVAQHGRSFQRGVAFRCTASTTRIFHIETARLTEMQMVTISTAVEYRMARDDFQMRGTIGTTGMISRNMEIIGEMITTIAMAQIIEQHLK